MVDVMPHNTEVGDAQILLPQPRGNCNSRFENSHFKTGVFKTEHFVEPYFHCSEPHRLD